MTVQDFLSAAQTLTSGGKHGFAVYPTIDSVIPWSLSLEGMTSSGVKLSHRLESIGRACSTPIPRSFCSCPAVSTYAGRLKKQARCDNLHGGTN